MLPETSWEYTLKVELRLENPPSGYRIVSFEDNVVMIGEIRHTESLIVTPEQVVREWPPQHVDQLIVDDLAMIPRTLR